MRRRELAAGAASFALTSLLGSCVTNASAHLWRIGYLTGNASRLATRNVRLIADTLHGLGYVEDRDFTIISRIAETDNRRLPGFASELAALPVDVIIAEAANAALAARDATSTIPIVFFFVTDPLGLGVATSIAHPGANITGIATPSAELSAKRLEWLRLSVPRLKRIAMLWNAHFPSPLQGGRQKTEDAARVLGIEVESIPISGADDLDNALEQVAQRRPDALLAIAGFGTVTRDYRQVPDFAAKNQLAQMYSDARFVTDGGGLMAIAPDYDAMARRTATFVDKVLKGARAGDLPIEVATQIECVVDVAAAGRIGISIPDAVLRQATQVLNG